MREWEVVAPRCLLFIARGGPTATSSGRRSEMIMKISQCSAASCCSVLCCVAFHCIEFCIEELGVEFRCVVVWCAAVLLLICSSCYAPFCILVISSYALRNLEWKELRYTEHISPCAILYKFKMFLTILKRYHRRRRIHKLCQDLGIGAQFGGKYFCHDVRVIYIYILYIL